jgi:hypothetical protein
MSVTLFGSCRINDVKNSNNLNNLLNYTHSTKEVIQLIEFLKGEKNIPTPYNKLCFRTPIIFPEIDISSNEMYKQLFIDSEYCVIEICSKKLYTHNGYYLHHLCVDRRFSQWNKNTPKDIFDNYKIEIQTDAEILNDIIHIKKILSPKKIIIVSHYNSLVNNVPFAPRNELILLLKKICNDNDIPFINPTEVLKDYNQNEVISDDLGHFLLLGLKTTCDYIDNYIKTI